MTRLFALAIFLSAALLFMVQPLSGKILLPVLGGSPSVWSTCLVFFQAVLLLGYLYAHLLTTRLTRQWPRLLHLGLLVAASLMLPMPVVIGEPTASDPRWWLMGSLAGTVGLPFFALSATAPLLQRWFSQSSERDAGDPYFLYAASNAGSLLGLLGYLLVEPAATRSAQAIAWSAGFWLVAALIAACAYVSVRRAHVHADTARVKRNRNSEGESEPARNPGAEQREPRAALWIVLALVPSALLLGVTQHLATDVVSAPLLWVVPLALYLITFIVAFSRRGGGSARRWGAVAPAAALLVLVLSLAEVRYPILPIALAHLAAFTVLAMLCHTRLAESRPDPVHLTRYFVCVALGGVLGSAAIALVAPLVFPAILEYPLAIGAALLLRPQHGQAAPFIRTPAHRWAWHTATLAMFALAYWLVSSLNTGAGAAPAWSSTLTGWVQALTGTRQTAAEQLGRASLALAAAALLLTPKTSLLFAGTAAGLLVGAGFVRTGGDVLHRERTFFGVHEVASQQNGDWHVLTHGTTTHGVQAIRGKVRLLPTAYYHPTGPIGDVVFTLAPEGRFRDVAVIGLGAGAMAAYAGNGTRMDFFEVDEAVIRIAENPRYFTYLSEARARPGTALRTLAVDGRIGVRAMPDASYDLIVVDAFSSDAIPTHLITREAVAMFAARLKPRGMMAFHVSSRFFNLAPVLAAIADAEGLVCYARHDRDVPPERAAEAMRPSDWVVVARNETDLGQLAHAAPRWRRLSGAGATLWTDDYTNVFAALSD